MDSQKNKIWIGIVLLVVLTLIVVFYLKGPNDNDDIAQSGLSGEPIDLVLDFYSDWIERKKVENVDATTPNPVESELLSIEVYEQLKDFDFSTANTELDPVLCRTTLPNGLRSKVVFTTETKQQIMIVAADKQSSEQSTITLEKNNDLWQIVRITCGSGEEGPVIGEFSFDNEGSLLKDGLPDGFNTDYWHLVFNQDDMEGFTAALLIDEVSICVDKEGNENVCDPSTFFQTMRVHVQGQLSEAGVIVKRIETL
jgi:hypothetical protein